MDANFYSRYRRPILIAAVCLFPLMAIGAFKAKETNENRVLDWLPAKFEETDRFLWFMDHFGSDELLMISWDGCDINDEESRQRLKVLVDQLTKPEVRDDGTQHGPWFRDAFTGPSVVGEFMDPPLLLTRRQAFKRMEGWLIESGATAKMRAAYVAQSAVRPNAPLSSFRQPAVQTCAIALISDAGRKDRDAAVAHVRSVVDTWLPEVRSSLHIAGSTIETVAINEASGESLPRLSMISLFVVFCLMIASFRHVGLALIVLAIAIFCQQMALATMWVTGARLDSIGLMVPTLVYILVISAAVHLVNYYRDEISLDDGFVGAELRAARAAWKPCLLASLTTALGLGSLAVSQLIPIRRFGIYAAVGVVLSAVVLFTLGPALLAQFTPRRLRAQPRWFGELTRDIWSRVGGVVVARRNVIAIVGLSLFVVMGYGAARIQPTARLHNLFRPEARVIKDYEWLETNIGSLVPVEIIVQIPKSSDASMLEKMVFIATINDHVHRVEGIDVTVRAANFMRPLPSLQGGLRQTTARTIVEHVLRSERSKFIDLRMLQDTPDEELWRISARVKASDESVDYGDMLTALEEELAPVFAAVNTRDTEALKRQKSVLIDELPTNRLAAFEGVDVTICGSIPLVHKAQQQLLVDLYASFLSAFVVIAITMVVLLRSLSAGLLSMVPNLLPTILVFGAMGFAGIEIEIGSMMTASAALGIAVDDTLHFITWFRRGIQDGMTRRDAIQFAYDRCATAMLQTSLICGIGMFVLVVSPFVPISRFAWLMASMLSAALLADLIILPAILAGPLGACFIPRNLRSTES